MGRSKRKYLDHVLLMLYFLKSSVCTSDAACLELNNEVPDFRVSPGGYSADMISNDICSTLCMDQEFNYASMLSGWYCLCGQDISSFEELDLSKCNLYCSGNSQDICGSNDTNFMYAIQVDNVEAVNNITIFINKNIISTENELEIELIIDSPGEYQASIDFGDGTSLTFFEKPYSVKKSYVIPGTYLIHASAVDMEKLKPSVFDETEVQVEEAHCNFNISCPRVGKPEIKSKCMVTLFKGSYLTMFVQVNNPEDDISILEVPDPVVIGIGHNVFPIAKEEEKCKDFMNKIVVLPYVKIRFESLLLGFEFYMQEEGSLDLMVLQPTCDDNERYCGAPYDIKTCRDEKTLCSLIGECVESENFLKCAGTPKDVQDYDIKYLISTTASPGYNYHAVFPDESYIVQPGDIIGFKTTEDSLVSCRKATSGEIENNIQDASMGSFLGVRHYFQAIVSEPFTLTLENTFNLTGNYTLTVSIENFWPEVSVTQSVTIPIQVPISGAFLKLSMINVMAGTEVFATVLIANGSDIKLVWNFREEIIEEIFYTGDLPEGGFSKSFVCDSNEDYFISANVSNLWNYEEVSNSFHCYLPIPENFNLTSDSPRPFPSGKVTFNLEFHGPSDILSSTTTYGIDFGDGNFEYISKVTFDDGKPIAFDHIYFSVANYTAFINVSNVVDFKIFQTIVELYEEMGNLSVTPYYVKDGSYPDDKVELKGLEHTDAPVGSTIYYETEISGYVSQYLMRIDEGLSEESSTSKIFVHSYSEVGEWTLTFRAWNSKVHQYSNSIILQVKILEEIPDYIFNVSSTEGEVDEMLEFTVSLLDVDDFTCLMFDGGDGGKLQAFGNENVCCTRYETSKYQFHEKPNELTNRNRREASDAKWIDYSKISISYSYIFGGIFPAVLDVFNSVSQLKKSLLISVADGNYRLPLVWIEDNSTDKAKPMKRERGIDFRLETTAIFKDDASYVASHIWSLFKVYPSGVEEEIDVSDLNTHNCSAIRIPKRFLEFGLYKFKYMLTVYVDDINKTAEETYEAFEDEDYYEKFLNSNDEEEDETFAHFSALPVLGKRSAYTYMEITSTPLIPMVIRGGAFSIVRGLGQKIMLEPTKYTQDPDFPAEKDYEVTWFCFRPDLGEGLVKTAEFDYERSNPSKPIRDGIRHSDYKGGCFGEGAGVMKISSGDFQLKGDMFWSWDAEYEIVAVIRKSEKVTEGRLIIKIIEEKPPSIILLCEKDSACFPQVQGQFVNPNSFILLKMECVEDCGDGQLLFNWTIYSSDLKTKEKKIIQDWDSYINTDANRLGINETLFVNHPELEVVLVVASASRPDPSIPTGQAEMLLLRNHSPTDGKCTISTTTGRAMIDLFEVKFHDWNDRDGHHIVDYSIYIKYGDEMTRLLYGLKSNLKVVLPYGYIEVWCSVQDEIGAVTMYSISNFSTILPSEEEFKAFEESRVFDKILAEGNMAMASQIMVAKNSIIVEYKKRGNVTGDFEQVSEEAITNKLEEYFQLEGADSSFYTPQARDEVREQLTERQEILQDLEAKAKTKELKEIVKLPMDAIPDVEVFGAALSAIADNGATNMKGKESMMNGIDKMFTVLNESEVPHPGDLKVALSQFGNLADSVAGSLADSNIAGQFLPGERKRAEAELNYNATEPNYFLYFVDGSKKEVDDRLKERAVEAAKERQLSLSKEMVTKIKGMVSSIQKSYMEDLIAGGDPFFAESKNGFQLTLLKRDVGDLNNVVIQQGDASVTLPNICDALTTCESSRAIGIQAVRWTQPLESYGEGSSNLSDSSNVVQIELTDGGSSISVTDAKSNFTICIPNEDNTEEMEYIVPRFERYDDILIYHKVFVESRGLAAKVHLKLDDPSAPLILLFKFGEQPSLFEYDDLMLVTDLPSEKGVRSLFIGSQFITGERKNLSVAIGHLGDEIDRNFFENPKMFALSVANMTNNFSSNYSIKITISGCYYFDEKEDTWRTDGCNVKSVGSGVTCCDCNHLTSFGSGLFVAPNEIDFSYVFGHADVKRNVTIYVTLIVSLAVFVLLLIYARWKDRQDLKKLGATPLSDNESSDKYIYEVLVFTGHQRNAGTKSNVFFIASGEEDETEVRHLSDEKRPILRKGSVDVFVMTVPRCLGQFNYLRIWHDNSGEGKWSSWYAKYIVFRDIQAGHKFEFIINRWLAVEEDDGMIDRLVPVAGHEQSTEFSHLFATSSRRHLADSHMWLSVFLRPPRSRFTRVQRVCCCMAALCLSMLTSAMYYQRAPPAHDTSAFRLGPLSLTPQEIAVGLVSNFLIFPPTFVMIFFFRKSRPRQLRPSRIEEALKTQRDEWRKNRLAAPRATDSEAQTFRRRRRFTLPWWCVLFGWLLATVAIGASLFFLWAYGVEFGDERTSKWLTSLVIAFFSSVLVTQPLKIVLMAIVMSCICRSSDYDEDDADEDEEDPRLLHDEEYLHNGERGKRAAYRPMELAVLEAARRDREKEVKMYAVVREIAAYFLFLWIIMILSYGNRDPNNFFLRQSLLNGFVKPGDMYLEYHKVNTEKKFWNWTHNALMPELFAGAWYNGNPPLGLRLFLDDRNNLKIGYAVLRQVRIKPASCDVSWMMRSITPECAGFGSVASEDGATYTRGWAAVDSADTLVPPEYKYLSAAQLRGYPFWGQVDWYGGGGYVVPLIAKRDSNVKQLAKKLHKLERDSWIDRHTRAIFVEVGIYNAAVNLFCAITILAEFLPGGGVIPYYHIDPLRLLNYHTGFGLLQAIVEVLFVVFTVFFTVKEILGIAKEGRAYFRQYWNIAELVSIVVSYTGIANHLYKMAVVTEILRIFTETEGTGYVKLQEAVLLNELFCYQIGLVMSISTLKFLKLLRFNKRIGILSSTLRKCAEELQSYAVCLMVVFMAFVVLFWLLLGRCIREFSTFVYSFESSISMMLKKFDYEAMYAASPVFTPVAFFTFSLATAVVLINILLSIIIRSFEDVKHDPSMQSNEYEILEFFVQRVKQCLGIRSAKVRPSPDVFKSKVAEKTDAISSFPNKVDRLVDFINDFYFDSQMDFSSRDFLRKMSMAGAEANERAKKTLPVRAQKSNVPKSLSDRLDF